MSSELESTERETPQSTELTVIEEVEGEELTSYQAWHEQERRMITVYRGKDGTWYAEGMKLDASGKDKNGKQWIKASFEPVTRVDDLSPLSKGEEGAYIKALRNILGQL